MIGKNRQRMFEIEREIGRSFKDILNEEYIENKISMNDIATKYGLKAWFIQEQCKKYNIKTRDYDSMHSTEKFKLSKMSRTMEKSSSWKGGRRKNAAGYYMLYHKSHPFSANRGYILEHRLIIENYLKENDPDNKFLIEVDGFEGKWLDPNSHVHHKNAIRDDNRVENLQVLTAEEHGAIHMKYNYTLEELEKVLLDFLNKFKSSSSKKFEDNYDIPHYIYELRYGSWINAITKVVNENNLKVKIKKRQYSDEDLEYAMREIYNKLNRIPNSKDVERSGYAVRTFTNRFGKFQKVIDHYKRLGIFNKR